MLNGRLWPFSILILSAHFFKIPPLKDKMKKEMEMICVSDLEGFNREKYEKSKKQLTKHMEKFGWDFGECVIEENNKVWSCTPAVLWFQDNSPDPTQEKKAKTC